MLSRRAFVAGLGASAAGLCLGAPIWKGRSFARTVTGDPSLLTPVAITRQEDYLRSAIRQKIEHLFDSLGGLADVASAGDRVAIKLNLTGGSGSASSPKLGGLPITESMWTHPEVVRAVAELLIDSGVRGEDIVFVEALWDTASFTDFGYEEVRRSIGASLVNLNAPEPDAEFIDLPVPGGYFYSSFRANRILSDVDVYVSIAKLKQHYEAGVTGSLKNQIGMVPKHLYTLPTDSGRRGALHSEGGPSGGHLPRSICDLNLARPVQLAVIDGIKNARGGEGVWNPTWQLWQDHVLLAGKDPVATDSISSFLMGMDPQAEYLDLPAGGRCDNYLDLLRLRGAGTNRMDQIELVGDGAVSVGGSNDEPMARVVELHQNYPNPFNSSTSIDVSLPVAGPVTLKLYNIMGEEVATLAAGHHAAGRFTRHWDASGHPSGVYFYRLTAGEYVLTRRMVLMR